MFTKIVRWWMHISKILLSIKGKKIVNLLYPTVTTEVPELLPKTK